MAAVKVEPVVLDGGMGKCWWEHPDFLWRGRQSVRERRLRVTLSRVILPLLQGLETLQRKHYPQAQLLLQGKSLAQVENDPAALEFALFLYDLTLGKDLILTRQGNKGGLVSVRKCLDAAVGSCGLTPNDVARRYVSVLAEPILHAGGHSADDFKVYVPTNAQSHVASLARLRTLASLDKVLVVEMRSALGGLDALAMQEKSWLDALSTASVRDFLRPMRKALEDNFEVILTWPAALLTAAIGALDHPVKVEALGRNVQDIKSAEIFKALGAWPMAKGKQGETLCRIAMIKKQLGGAVFSQLLQGSPGLLKDLGTWPHKRIELYKEYLPIISGPVMQILTPLEEVQRLAMMSGLKDRFGPKKLSGSFKTKEGLGALQGVVNEIAVMNETAKQTPAKVRKLKIGRAHV